MNDQFTNLPFLNERVSAVTPKNLKNYNIKKNISSKETDYEVCCLISHIKAIKKGYDQNHEYFIVCEDDMYIPDIDFDKLMKYISHYEIDNEKIDILQMFTNGHPCILKLFNEEFANGKFFKKHNNDKYPSAGLYLVSREGAKNILDQYMISNYDFDFSSSDWIVADNLIYQSVNTCILTYPFFVSNTNFISEIHSDHRKYHIMANNIVKEIQKKHNYNHLILNNSKNKSVQTQLFAGLCNQIFMIFTTIAYSIKNNIDYSFHTQDSTTITNGNPVYFNNLLKNIKHKTTPFLIEDFEFYNEENFHHNEIPVYEKNLKIRGFFQSYKYFEKEYDEILHILGIRSTQTLIQEKYKHLFTKPCISIHFRQGDYIYLKENHPILPKEYYFNAIQYLEKHLNLNDYNILYFCQEIDNKNVEKYIDEMNLKYNFIKVSDNIPDWEQLILISLCQHHIIANSSFSWWGAYFSSNSNKMVCYPMKNWFGPALVKHNLKDLCPLEWIKIDY